MPVMSLLRPAVNHSRRRLFAVLSGVVVAAACARGTHSNLTGLEAAQAKARSDSARWPYTAADIHFMSTMIHHHAQAIVMAKMAPSHGASESVQRLCERIINAQS